MDQHSTNQGLANSNFAVRNRASSWLPCWWPTGAERCEAPADVHHRPRIVPVVSPRRMVKMNDKVAIVGRHRLVEHDPADAPPIADGAALCQQARGPAIVGYFDVKGQRPLGAGSPRSYILPRISSRKSRSSSSSGTEGGSTVSRMNSGHRVGSADGFPSSAIS